MDCHSEAAAIPQSPYFASANMAAAYDAAQAKIDLDNPGNSRFVLRLRQESHNCWNQCDDGDQDFMDTDDSGIMQTAIHAVSPQQVVDLADPAMSIMVGKVRGGHNCWLSDDNACGDNYPGGILIRFLALLF